MIFVVISTFLLGLYYYKIKVYNKGYAKQIPVFTWHRIVTDEMKRTVYSDNQWAHSVTVFEQQMKYLHDHHYRTLSLDEFYDWYTGKRRFRKKTVVITFDDGNADDYYLVLPILKKYKLKATTFIVGYRTEDKSYQPWTPEKRTYITKEMMQKVAKTYPNWQFESHTWDMHKVDKNGKEHLLNLTPRQIALDFKKNSVFGFKYLAYPYGIYNDAIKKELEKNNYRLAFGFRDHEYATRKSKRYQIPRIKINGFSTVETLKEWLNY